MEANYKPNKEQQRQRSQEAERFDYYEREWSQLRTEHVKELEVKISTTANDMLKAVHSHLGDAAYPIVSKLATCRADCGDIKKLLDPLAASLRDDMVLGAIFFLVPPTGAIAPQLDPAWRATL